MDKLIPGYSFEQNLMHFRNELLYIGTTYYDRYLVFEHLNKYFQTFLEYTVYKTELYFLNEKLYGISIYLEEKFENLNSIIESMSKAFGQVPAVFEDEIISPIGNKKYCWMVNNKKVGLLTEDEQIFVSYSLKRFGLFW